MSVTRGPGAGSGRSPGAIVVFGSSGDLATTKVFPAIEGEAKAGRLGRSVRAIGVDRRPPRHAAPHWLEFVQGDLTRQETYERLAEAMDAVPPEGGALFYLATPPRLFPEVVQRLQKSGLVRPASRVAVEKPFGVDLRSSRLLEARLGSAFARKRVFRVDHFLCKDGALGMEHFRFADGGLESRWNGRYVDSVQIMADEKSGLVGRGDFYDAVGVARDMAQNHLLQLLCLVAMDRPGPGTRTSGNARAEVLKSMAPIVQQDVVWGQFRGYQGEAGVHRGSATPTFVALKISVRNERWEGVPFYLRTGKLLARDATEVVVTFKGGRPEGTKGPGAPRLVRFGIDPSARTRVMRGRSEAVWKDPRLTGASEGEYQRVVQGVLEGDQRRFAGREFNELSWELFDPIIKGQKAPDMYDPGGWGPASSDSLLAREGRRWLDGR